MKTFLEFLEESKNLHMEHLEDLVFLRGIEGTRQAIEFLRGLRDMLGGQGSGPEVTMKWDGAPAIFCGKDPESGRFFVGTKSVFNKRTPKINFTDLDIEENHGSGDLADKLKLALKELRRLELETVVQGDFLFAPDTLKQKTIDGKKYITFRPNTITYAVPADSPVAKEILNAKLGIVFHTEYTGGKTLQDTSARFISDLPPMKNQPDLWVQSAGVKDFSGPATLSENETKQVQAILSELGRTFRKLDRKFVDWLQSEDELQKLVLIHLNELVRQGRGKLEPKKHARSLVEFIGDRYEKEAGKRKTDKGKQTQRDKGEEISRKIKDNEDQFVIAFHILNLIRDAKEILLEKMEQVQALTDAFIEDADGFRVTKPEGFVAISSETGDAVKLVNRLEFARANFQMSKEQFGK